MSCLAKIVTCWQIKLKNDKKLNFTDHDEDLNYGNELYLSGSYFTPGSVSSANELAQDNFTISGSIDNSYISYESIMAGDLAEGYVEVFLIDLEKLNEPKTILKTGWIGEIKFSGNKYIAEIISIGGKTNNIIGNCYSSSCRAEFGNKDCKIDLNQYSYEGMITSLGKEGCFYDENRAEPDEYFAQGKVIFVSGKNQGKSYSVIRFSTGKITLDFASIIKLSIGDKYRIIVGCDKTVNSCINKFNNILNFRGEPYIPSKHKLVDCN